MDAMRIAQVLDDMGTMLEINGENPFRCRAYHQAARVLNSLTDDLEEMITDGRLRKQPGIGDDLHAKIVELATTGRLQAYEDLRRTTGPGLVALLRIPGLGPKKIKALHEALKIESLADLRRAAEAGKIAGLKGFGEKTQANILEGIKFVESAGDRILLNQAHELVEPIFEALRNHKGVIRAEVCGSLRRCAETIGDLDILISSRDPAPILDEFVKMPQVAAVLVHGPTKASIRLQGGIQCDLRGVDDAQFPFALQYFTGSKAHNIITRRRAIARGLTLNEYGLTGEGKDVHCRDEAELYAALGLTEIPPELREDQGEFEAAEAGTLPKLIERDDLTGTFHCHTNWSDGRATLEEMAEGAIARGFTYLGIADHSRSAHYAGGLSIERVHEQWDAIDALNRKYGRKFQIFKGTECDVLADGSLDFPDDLLKGFDYVVASIHTHFTLPRAETTRRVVRAVSNPHVTMLGHATGRLLLARNGYDVDLDAVFAAAAKSGTLIEINANPHRLDLDSIHARRARQAGVGIVINPDAHSVAGIDDLKYGVMIARRAWLRRDDVLNTHSFAAVRSTLERLRARSS